MRIFFFVLCLGLVVFASCAESSFEFKGRHYLASYNGCDLKNLKDTRKLAMIMKNAVLASGAFVLNSTEYHFPQGGFTCGDCKTERFDQVLRTFLKPKNVSFKVFIRNHSIEEDLFYNKN